MTNENTFSLKRLRRSFGYAINGIKLLFRNERNAQIHLVVTVAVVAAGFCFSISPYEWMAVAFAIGSVLAAEAFNTAVERLSDVVSPQKDERIKQVKDLAAGAVLLLTLAAVATGLIIFIPKIIG